MSTTESRPDLLQRPTAKTLVPENPSEYGNEDTSDPEKAAPASSRPSTHDEAPVGPEKAAPATSRTSIHDEAPANVTDTEAGTRDPLRITTHDTLLLAGLFVMLVWPWIFLGVVWGVKGVQMNNHVAKVVTDHPHSTAFFVTLIGNIVSLIVSILFAFAIIRFAQEWVTSKKDVTAFDISVLAALRHQNWPWGMDDLKHPAVRNGWLPVTLVGACIATFAFVPSSTTSLITPAQFNRTAPLIGTELDFSSSAADCLEWFAANPISNNCDWKTFKGLNYTDCLGENQMVDVLESGRGNILSLLSNNSQTLAFSQLGARDGMHFLGPIRGVLPIGPNGVPAFDTLRPSPFSSDEVKAGMLSYNYTLDYQGFTSNISCKYEQESPIRFAPVLNNTRLVAVTGTCDGLADVLTNVIDFPTPNTNNTLTFWACKSAPTAGQEPTYYIYLRGRLHYEAAIGNITCAVSPIQPAIFPVIYQSGPSIFLSKEPIATSANTFPGFIERALVALGGLVWEAQNSQTNLVAESVITFGVKAFRLPPYEQSEQYLRLYEAMLQGIIEYETTYTRLIYLTKTTQPESCNRAVTGSVSYLVVGWFVTAEDIGFLMPMTIVILAALIVLLIAIFNARRGGYKFDPLKPNALLAASRDVETGKPINWEDKVKYQPDVINPQLANGAQELKDQVVDAVVSATSG